MKKIATSIPDLFILEPKLFLDERGYFMESYNEITFNDLGFKTKMVQDNQSKSSYGVLRGLHFQSNPKAQSKLIRVLEGKILDVAVDIRKGSPTYGKYEMVELSSENQKQLFVPKGFAHGFLVLSETATVLYKCDEFYSPEHEVSIAYNCPEIGIDWPIDENQLIISEKDKNNTILSETTINFTYD